MRDLVLYLSILALMLAILSDNPDDIPDQPTASRYERCISAYKDTERASECDQYINEHLDN